MGRANNVVAIGLLLGAGLAGGCSTIPEPTSLPPEVSFNGTWQSNWGTLRLTQNQANVFGRLSGFRNGSVSGKLLGNQLRFKWTQRESQLRGRGYFMISRDGEHIEGRWGYDDEYDSGGRWWAARVH